MDSTDCHGNKLPRNDTVTGLYIHYPFCLSKCAYCDFNSVVAKDIDDTALLSAFIRDLQYYHNLIGYREIDTIYFGGGTPSLMKPEVIKAILVEVHNLFNVLDNAEITLEANPLTAETSKFEAFREAGINRLSLGVQSFSDEGLKALGREHELKQTIEALKMVKKLFNRSSFDLIYGWEGQTLAEWQEELKTALKYENGHLSLYQLTIYDGTPLAKTGAEEIDDETSLLFQEKAQEVLASNGIDQYEISNYARKGEESQHNLIYWHYDDYIGIGAGASGRLTINGVKTSFKNQDNINDWLKHCSPEKEELSKQDQAEEYLLMGLRLNKGINLKDFKEKTGLEIVDLLKNLEELSEFIKIENEYVFATKKGLDCLNTLLSKIL